MKFYQEEVVRRARAIHLGGASIKNIESRLGIPDSTISHWVRDVKSKNRAFTLAREKEYEAKKYYLGQLENIATDTNSARVFSSLLYWCEGSKHPSTNFVAFSNSDEKLVKTFLSLLRKGFRIDESKLLAHLQLHTTHDINASIKYWAKLLKIPENKFYRPTITKPNKLRKRNDYRGTCTIKYFDVKLLLGLMGIYESFCKKIIAR